MLRFIHIAFFLTTVNVVVPQNYKTNSIHSDFVINKEIDMLLKYAREAIRDDNMDRISIPDVSETFFGPLGTKGQFLATNGSVAYLSSVQRTGDAHMVSGRTSVRLTVYLGLEELVLDFNHYETKYLDVGPTGKMRATIGNNSIYAVILLEYNVAHCTEALDTLIVERFDGIALKLTGIDPFNWLLDDIAEWVEKSFQDNIRSLVEDTLRNAVKNALTKYNICKFLPHPPHRKVSERSPA